MALGIAKRFCFLLFSPNKVTTVLRANTGRRKRARELDGMGTKSKTEWSGSRLAEGWKSRK